MPPQNPELLDHSANPAQLVIRKGAIPHRTAEAQDILGRVLEDPTFSVLSPVLLQT